MTVELHDLAPPNEVAFMLAHLLPFAGAVDKLGSKRWAAGMPLPYVMVNSITARDDLISSYSVVSVHWFAGNETDAWHFADDGHRRVLVLADDPLTDVVMADNSLANCEWLETLERPHPVPYGAESVVTRLVSRYQLGLHFGTVT